MRELLADRLASSRSVLFNFGDKRHLSHAYQELEQFVPKLPVDIPFQYYLAGAVDVSVPGCAVLPKHHFNSTQLVSKVNYDGPPAVPFSHLSF